MKRRLLFYFLMMGIIKARMKPNWKQMLEETYARFNQPVPTQWQMVKEAWRIAGQ